MRDIFRKTITHPALALGSTVLWGLVEFMALQKSRRRQNVLTAKNETGSGSKA